MRRILLALLILALLPGVLWPALTSAATQTPQNKGLYLAPLRNYLALNTGQEVTRAFTVANRTDQPMNITTSLEEFSVTDYSYDYRFEKTDNNWVKLIERSFTLKPFESREVPYKISIPQNASPGGQYYTLYAASTSQNGTTTNTIRAGTLLYLTVNGDLKYSSQVVERSLPWIVIQPQIRYTLDIKNTGNIHYFGYFESEVRGLFYHDAPNGSSQLLMPGKIRSIDNSIRSPLIPGIYRLTYSYTPDNGPTINGSHYFVFLPPWSIALFIIIAAIGTQLIIHRIKRRRISIDTHR